MTINVSFYTKMKLLRFKKFVLRNCSSSSLFGFSSFNALNPFTLIEKFRGTIIGTIRQNELLSSVVDSSVKLPVGRWVGRLLMKHLLHSARKNPSD